MRKRLLTAAILFALPASAQQSNSPSDSPAESAPATQSDYSAKSALRDFFADEYRMWTSPFRVSDYDAHTMGKYGFPFLGASAALIATDQTTSRGLPKAGTQAYIWSGRVSQIGAPYTLAGATATLFFLSKATHEDHLTETGFLSMEALAHSELIGLGIKEMTQRERPVNVTGSLNREGFWDGGASFPSGHATGSFAVATVIAYEYGDQHIAVPIIGFTLASIVSASRVSGRQHWVSDVFVGSALGFMEGRYIYKRHHNPDLPGSPTRRVSRLIPAFDIGTSGGSLYWEF
jgi:membrane-associated phospholipid phosphatase